MVGRISNPSGPPHRTDWKSVLREEAAWSQHLGRLFTGGSRERRSRRWPVAAEGPQDLVKVFRDGHLVVEEVLQPEVIVPVRQGHQGQQVAEADVDVGFRVVALYHAFRGIVNA